MMIPPYSLTPLLPQPVYTLFCFALNALNILILATTAIASHTSYNIANNNANNTASNTTANIMTNNNANNTANKTVLQELLLITFYQPLLIIAPNKLSSSSISAPTMLPTQTLASLMPQQPAVPPITASNNPTTFALML